LGLRAGGTQVIKKKRGIQWDRSQIRESQEGLGLPKKGLKSEWYHSDEDEESNQMNQVSNQGEIWPQSYTHVDLYSDMNNMLAYLLRADRRQSICLSLMASSARR
jgi:hypothetical protein